MQPATYWIRSGSGSSGWMRRISADKASPEFPGSAKALEGGALATHTRISRRSWSVFTFRVEPRGDSDESVPSKNGPTSPISPRHRKNENALESPHADGFGSLAPHQHCTESPKRPRPRIAGSLRALPPRRHRGHRDRGR